MRSETCKEERDKFLALIKASRCIECGRVGVDIAHIPRWSEKIGGFIAPSHKGNGWFFAIPLCRMCHLTQHRMGYTRFAGPRMRAHYKFIADAVANVFDVEVPEGLSSPDEYGRWIYKTTERCKQRGR